MQTSKTAVTTLERPIARSQPPKHEVSRRFRVGPTDVGGVGCVDGGTLLEWCHHAAAAAALGWSGRRCVTASVGNIHLDRAIGVGEIVDVQANVVYTGRTSLHILITVCSIDPTRSNVAQSTQCSMVFVAVDDGGDPVGVPSWIPSSMLELQRQRQARVRTRMRTRIEGAMANAPYTVEGSALRTTLRRVASHCDVTHAGTVGGGRILRWMDDACRASGAEWSGTEVITSYLAGVRFVRPIPVGHTVEIAARVIHTGPRSIHCDVRVTDIETTTSELVAEAVAVVVSPDEAGRARHVPKWHPATGDERLLERRARQLIELRQFIEPFTMVTALACEAEAPRRLTGRERK
jgi:acyl-CoA hydrolase